jgi:hypothetical protein
MPLIEAALAFAITMLALSLVVSSFVEIIHRALKMREAGLKYMLEQLFDQVLVNYVEPLAKNKIKTASAAIAEILKKEEEERKKAEPKNKPAEGPARTEMQVAYQLVRDSFVERMTANRAPVGLKADPTLSVVPKPPSPAGGAAPAPAKPGLRPGNIWGGRRVTQLTPADFMERLGSIDVGAEIKSAATAGANVLDDVLKDIAQKFEGFGKDAASYFEGRARMLSVIVAIALAFAVHVDAIDLFSTYLRDPNARAKVIEQSQAVTAQYKASQEAIETLKKLGPAASSPDDVKKQVEALEKDSATAITKANAAVSQYADLGVPLGWTVPRIEAANIGHLVGLCRSTDATPPPWVKKCKPGESIIWFEDLNVLGVWFYLFLGGLLIGLGSPFWYDVVTGLTTIRNAAGGQKGGGAAPQSAAAPAAADAAKAQPVTPVGAFETSNAAAARAKLAAAAAAAAAAAKAKATTAATAPPGTPTPTPTPTKGSPAGSSGVPETGSGSEKKEP